MENSYDDVVDTYRENYFDKYSADQLNERRDRLYGHILNVIDKKRQVGQLLDVGTGCGFFLVAAKERQWKVKGVEPSVQSVDVARGQNGLDVFCGTLGQYDGNGQFDVITFINVLDHSTLPWLEINRACELLRPGGLIYLRFPNGFLHSRILRIAHKSRLTNSLRKFLVFHIYAFTPKYIKRLLHDQGFTQTTVLNSPPSEGDPHKLFPNPIFAVHVKKLFYSFAKCTETISCGKLFLGTSLEVTAIKPDSSLAH
jgi:2-polyprenyl-3-methyl-5-hydroxy-6-metoxy-1,4-benzoquinol methylase